MAEQHSESASPAASLERTVNQQVRLRLLNATLDGFLISNVDVVRCEVGRDGLESREIVGGISVGAEEVHPLVVVDSIDLPAPAIKVFDRFRPNQTTASRNQQRRHISPLLKIRSLEKIGNMGA